MNGLQDSLFSSNVSRPLADRMRPESISDVVGQDHLLGADAPLRRMIDTGNISSFILWGPPGCGKTTLAKILANNGKLHFVALSAVFSGVADLRKAFNEAEHRRQCGQGTLLFVDEIHRFNRAQQDGFLPYVENGTVVLVGATTENPSFELNSALLSRCKVFVLKPLSENALEQLAARAEDIMKKELPLTSEARARLAGLADGDGRYFINLMETVYDLARPGEVLDVEQMLNVVQQRSPIYDKDREGHYNLISALHKSLRGSDCDAALYWMARMIAGGEDPIYILRRLTRFAVEDVGLADPMALQTAIAAWDAYERLGSPEGDLAITNLVIFLATCPKSNAAETAHIAAAKAAAEFSSLTPPAHILNAPTKLMKELGYNKGYMYDHDTPDGFSGQDYFPEKMGRRVFYRPFERGFEREISKRLAYWQKLREELKDKYDPNKNYGEKK
ncbi:MAG: replication-associated recombination protein A [Lentisphaeria bacterium]|nr:replication-associated recombination protein A [Lentisphaeria bacterium]MBO5991924.1 replication-associated recombination protein A [Lentisphaeria bacterium]MBO7152331.1 replication-associated recombination protein A [Lentisphaeria bacterium]